MHTMALVNVTTGRLTDLPGVSVGHWTNAAAQTGCTVILLPEGTVAAGEVRGGAPASREMALLEPTRTVATIDAVVLTGGSAFGLAAADGVMTFLEANNRGYVTPGGRVPIVPTLGLYDLAVGDAAVRPDAAAGHHAAAHASNEHHDVGLIGAGTGCTTGKWFGPDQVRAGGLVAASTRVGNVVVATLIAVNAAGAVGAAATILDAGTTHATLGTNTTIGVIATSAALTKVECHLLAQSAHVGLARAVFPSHTRFDGDAFIACATGTAATDGERAGDSAGIDALRTATTSIVEAAITSLATSG